MRKVAQFLLQEGMNGGDVTPAGSESADLGGREVWINGICMNTSEVEVKLDEGNILEAESALRDGLSLNFEEARALLGRLEYQRGNIEAALQVFDGIDLQAAINRLQSSMLDKPPSRKNRHRSESTHSPVTQNAASLVLEAIYMKALSLQKLGRTTEAAYECKSVLDAVEKIFPQGIPDTLVDHKLQETVSKAVELLPELWKQAGSYQDAIAAYRRALLCQWNLDNSCCARLQKRFSVFLLYGGVEAASPSLAVQKDGSFVPKNNIEEAVVLLLLLLQKIFFGESEWDPEVMEHLTFALALCGETSIVAKQLEEVLPGIFSRCERWNLLALCYIADEQNATALNLLRMSLKKHEEPNDPLALLLAAKLCSSDCKLAFDGVGYARRAIANEGAHQHLKRVGLRLLGLCLAKLAKAAASDAQKTRLQTESLQCLNEALVLDRYNPDLIFELGFECAEQRNLNAALRYAKQFIDLTGGSILKGWQLLALILSAQGRYSEAELVIDAALDETAKWEQGPLLKTRAKIKVAQSLPMEAIETYRLLLALVQAQKKSFGSFRTSKARHCRIDEFEVWHGLACMYSSLSHWKDAEICLDKARALKQYSASLLHTEGFIHESQGRIQDALASYYEALAVDPGFVPAQVSLGAILLKTGSKTFQVARSFLSDALRLEPTNRSAWYHLGMVHKDNGKISDACDCFQAAFMLVESDPIEGFSCIQR